ncbi:aminotransferase class III-fold pyridoxal phosphate-dependent enzyme [Salinisphaera sp.]|uniref:aminotransferase class III-fold pyridoxal phosphate-dependent enzyme n=1 Tax=Salinisphaera sp. TaxID=1914330 RepID=UPI002D78AC9C|nr:aminotransferase class III-fold pyridoxal phosphate-dependent enzyme [Salinisphaera sp.]HET7312799.1 aminotransferase class III-fold pyridoxal phosphate-dependent enzyme [Salinisphaera sp.]
MADIAEALNFDSYWMPFSGNRQFKTEPKLIVAAEGCHYTDADGRRVFDSLSGLWCVSFGHGRAEIAEAIASTAKTLDYAPPFQYAHPMAFELAERVRRLAPAGLEHVFFTNSGSESADTAIKIARAYWTRRGRPEKARLIGREKGYHGVNVGGTGVGGIPDNRAWFGDMLASEHLPHTLIEGNRFTRGVPAHGAEVADVLEQRILEHGAETVAAVMVEPVSGSGGVIVPPAGYLERLREICDRHDVLLIFDEVLTGFGRLGAAFGADLFGVTPDIMTLAKNLTNGAVPMGAVVTSDAIYDAFMAADLPRHAVELAHGYTYSAHPLACAAALAAMDIFENERMAERAAELAPYFEQQLHGLRAAPHVVDIRNLGLAGALEIETAGDDPTCRPWAIANAAWERGMYLRFGGNTVQLGPPFIAERADIDFMCDVLDAAIRSVD